MKLLEILKKHNVELPFTLGKEIGSGVDGQVFEKYGDDSRVIKLSYQDNFTAFENAWLIHVCQPKHFVSVFDFGCFNDTIFWVEMEKLIPLTEDENRLFHTLLSHEDANKQKQFKPEILNELANWLILDKQKAQDFCVTATSGPIKQPDLHIRNIMKNSRGDFKIIDLDRLHIL